MGRAFRGCCCGVAFLLVLAGVLMGWHGLSTKIPASNNTADLQSYTDSYHKAISDYTARLEKIMSDPKLKSAESAAQKHAAHIREMKEIVAAQDQCEHALKSINVPPDLAKFNSAMQEYFHDLSAQSQVLEASVKHKDVPELNADLKKIDESVSSAAADVDRQLAQVPHYEQGKKQILDLWSHFKKQVDQDLPPISN